MLPQSRFWAMFRKYVLNKYVLTGIIFLLIVLFVGEQSLINDIRRADKIRQTRNRLEETNQRIVNAEHDLNALQSTDSLERYAREHYYMHAPNEDVYIVTEK